MSNWVVGGRNGAAQRLGMKRTSLVYKMQKHRIVRPASSGEASAANGQAPAI
jgi:formate hydrogenlyase transcriptional activator